MLSQIIEKLNDGGPIITYPIVLLLIVIIILFIKELRDGTQFKKTKELLASIGWFVIAWGYLGRTFGLIIAFDNVAAAGEISPSLLSGGLKMALVGPMVALTTFVVARIAIIVLIVKKKNSDL
jgi:hypothetical protein